MRLAAYATVVATTAIIHRTNHRRGILTVVAHVVAVKLPWRKAVSLSRHTPRRFHCNRRAHGSYHTVLINSKTII
jgi:hypothetical protein